MIDVKQHLDKHQLICHQIIQTAERLYQRNMLAGADGNISVRLSDQEILITPSGISKAFMSLEEMAMITINNEIVFGSPSSERLMHLQIYKSCPQAKAVVHAHPPTAVAWSIADPNIKFLPSESLSEVILACGDIPFIPYARPGTEQMGENLFSFLPQFRAMILSRHGAITWGESLEEALRGMERIEHSSEILMKAKQLGDLTQLPKEEVQILREMRKKIGARLL